MKQYNKSEALELKDSSQVPSSFVGAMRIIFFLLCVFVHPEKSVQITSLDTSTKVLLKNNFEIYITWNKNRKKGMEEKRKRSKELQVEQK